MILFEQMEIPDFIKQNERHINKLKEDYIQFKKYKKDYDGKLNEKNYQDVQVIINNIVDTIIKEVDPTYNNKSGKANVYQSWILQTFAKQNKQGLQKFDEDLQKYKNYLIRYITYLEEIKIDNTKNINTNGTKILDTQINKYDTVFDLLDQLSKYEQKYSKQINVSQYSNIPDKIFELIKTGEIILVQELEKYMIFIPLTEHQQRLVGKDTEWCTQYQQRNTLFYNYNNQPLFSIRSKNVYKDNYQFYFSILEPQFKNNNDKNIDFDKFRRDHSDIVDVFINLFIIRFKEFYLSLKDSYTKFENYNSQINDDSEEENYDENKQILKWDSIMIYSENIYSRPELIFNDLLFLKIQELFKNDKNFLHRQLKFNPLLLRFFKEVLSFNYEEISTNLKNGIKKLFESDTWNIYQLSRVEDIALMTKEMLNNPYFVYDITTIYHNDLYELESFYEDGNFYCFVSKNKLLRNGLPFKIYIYEEFESGVDTLEILSNDESIKIRNNSADLTKRFDFFIYDLFQNDQQLVEFNFKDIFQHQCISDIVSLYKIILKTNENIKLTDIDINNFLDYSIGLIVEDYCSFEDIFDLFRDFSSNDKLLISLIDSSDRITSDITQYIIEVILEYSIYKYKKISQNVIVHMINRLSKQFRESQLEDLYNFLFVKKQCSEEITINIQKSIIDMINIHDKFSLKSITLNNFDPQVLVYQLNLNQNFIPIIEKINPDLINRKYTKEQQYQLHKLLNI